MTRRWYFELTRRFALTRQVGKTKSQRYMSTADGDGAEIFVLFAPDMDLWIDVFAMMCASCER